MNRKPFRRSTRGRSGFSLIELMCAITVFTLLSSLAAQLIVVMMQLGSGVGLEAERELTWQRLEDQFRSDANDSVHAEMLRADGGNRALVLRDAEGTQIEYQLLAQGVRRFARTEPGTTRQDYFHLGDGRVSIEIHRGSVTLLHDEWETTEYAAAEESRKNSAKRTLVEALLGSPRPVADAEGQP